MKSIKIYLITLLGLTSLLTACGLLGSNAAQPPLPTIVPASPTATIETASVADNPAEDNPSPTETAAPSHTPPPTTTPTPTAAPAPLDSINLSLIPVAGGLTEPVYLTHAGDGSGRLFVVEQPGNIVIIENGAVKPEPFLDIVSIVGSGGNEQGLLSLAFHPNYAENGYFFVNYTDQQGDTVIARYSVSDDPNRADPNSQELLMTIGQPYANHNGGHILFGPDGYLYIGMGDGGAANDPQNRAQDLGTLLGKILRIDVDRADPYGVPDSNPFVNSDEARPEIWSYGWRNPWRISFDAETGDMYIADVGQNQYEEVHVEWADAEGGKNYGWRIMEGFHCFNPRDCDPEALDLVLPVTEYSHEQGCSITGGYTYRGGQFPSLNGVYFYGDYCSGAVWGLRHEADGSWSQAELAQTGSRISSFGEDESGEVYLLDHAGEVFRISASE